MDQLFYNCASHFTTLFKMKFIIFAALFAVAAAAYIKTPAAVVGSSEEMASSELASSEPSDSTSSLYSAPTYFATTVKSEVEDEDNEDSEDDKNDTDESSDVNTIYTASTYATPVKTPAYTAPVYNKAADPKY